MEYPWYLFSQQRLDKPASELGHVYVITSTTVGCNYVAQTFPERRFSQRLCLSDYIPHDNMDGIMIIWFIRFFGVHYVKIVCHKVMQTPHTTL